MKRYSLLLFSLIIFTLTSYTQNNFNSTGFGIYEQPIPQEQCLNEKERETVKKVLQTNIQRLKVENKISTNRMAAPLFEWPLKVSEDLDYTNAVAVGYHLDHNPNNGSRKDYKCLQRTYDGHRGTDISAWPFPWHMYENDYLTVVAAAGGVIINKQDGNYDQECENASRPWNAIFVRHSDGSVAWYGHLKESSLTNKNIGDTVQTGEYLGVVASSGNSSGPHLHFEVYDSNGNLIDPYSGSCNSLNNSSWWNNQISYSESTLNAVVTHSANPQLGCPSNYENPNIENVFLPNDPFILAIYFITNNNTGDTYSVELFQPDGTRWGNANFESLYNVRFGYYTYNIDLPADGPFGTWTARVTSNGQTAEHQFKYVLSLMPVELTYFNGVQTKDSNLLTWETATENNSSEFIIEKSTLNTDWEEIGCVEASENSLKPKKYSYVDDFHYNQAIFYRLKMVDLDGTFEYSEIVSVGHQENAQFVISPNPSNNLVTVYSSDITSLQLYNLAGELLLENKNSNTIDISNFATGLYILKTNTINGSKQNKIIKY